jgi:molybdate transport system substrate-binding protein
MHVDNDGKSTIKALPATIFVACCVLAAFLFAGLLWGGTGRVHAAELLVFAGSASKPPAEELARLYEKKTGAKVRLTFGGSGFVLSQMVLARKGDSYFPGSSDYMETAKRKNLVFPDTERKVVYLVPAINVQKGNPKGIRGLADLTKPGVRIAIANPEGVCLGIYTAEIVERNMSPAQKAAFLKNVVNHTESCEKTATAVSLKAVDAVIGWSVFSHWDPVRIDTIALKKHEVARIGYIPIAVSTLTSDRSAAQKFVDFVVSDEGRAVFRKHHYFVTAEEAAAWIGEKKPVGGEYTLPAGWIKR